MLYTKHRVARVAFCAFLQRPRGMALVPAVRKSMRVLTGPAAFASAAAVISMTAKPAQAASAPVRVTTYNVLSSSLCEPEYFIKSSKEHLDPSKRLEKVKYALENETAKEAIICLQEVSRQWLGPLQIFFAAHGYGFSSSLYGKSYNGYMGVAIAWPMQRFELQDMEHLRLAELLPEPPQRNFEDKEKTISILDTIIKQFSNLFTDKQSSSNEYTKKNFDVWNEAQRRHNVLVSAAFRDKKGKECFSISTYHMPCLFGSLEKEQVMIIHAALAAQRSRAFARGRPFILTGDFNIKPEDACYAMLTKNYLPSEYSLPLQAFLPPEAKPFSPEIESPLISAYKAKNGKEPQFTNFAFTRSMNESFVATLDYIFLSEHWKVRFVKPLKSISEIDTKMGSFPDQDEPSDHILIAADLEIATATDV